MTKTADVNRANHVLPQIATKHVSKTHCGLYHKEALSLGLSGSTLLIGENNEIIHELA